ncbi:MAG: HlyD family efflux transporter periplasmic adaptor subunit [Planctomycetes bacterium]|nr:HlyD family efflux transporter periplasmic adaptor subunit [Planctomycetota bacterium]
MRRDAILFLSLTVLWLGLGTPDAAAEDASANVAPSVSTAIQAAEEEKKEEEDKKDEADKKEAEAEEKSDADKESTDAEKKAEETATEKKESKEEEKPAAKEAEKKEAPATEDTAKEKPDSKPEEKTPAKPEAKKRKTLKIEPKRLKIDLALDGTFVASKMEEVAFRPEAWTDYEIVEVVAHGQKVRKGETLFKFDSEKLNEAIADLELEQRLNELAILKAEEEMPRMEKTLKLDFAVAERSNQQAKEDFDRYREIDRPMMEKTAEFMVKYYDFMLAYETDELEQLEKMYEADDLTEETEEIVLKRQRNTVEFAEFGLESAKLSRDETLKISLPRYDIRIKEALERSELAQARAQMALSLDLNRARYELEQRKKARSKSLDRHAKLLADRELMEIKAPADGIVFYGQSVNGRWSDTATLINKYKPKNNVSAGSVLMTIVETRPMYVTSTVDEGKRPDVSDGKKAKIALPAEDAERVAAEVKSISPIPVSPGKFEINFNVTQDEIPAWIVPGMSGKIQVTTYNQKDAITVPKTAVHDDEDDEDQKYVWLVDPDDEEAKPERRNVKLGKRKGDDVEIVKGLKKGDVISLDDESKTDDESKKKDE